MEVLIFAKDFKVKFTLGSYKRIIQYVYINSSYTMNFLKDFC